MSIWSAFPIAVRGVSVGSVVSRSLVYLPVVLGRAATINQYINYNRLSTMFVNLVIIILRAFI